MEQILKLSVYSAQPPLAGCADKLVGYSKLRSQQCDWHLATRGWPDNFRWGLRGETEGEGWARRRTSTGLQPALWSGSSRVADGELCEPEERSQSSLGHSEDSSSSAAPHLKIIWLLSLQVPLVESKFPLPDGKTDNAKHVLVFSVTLSAGADCRLREDVSRGLLIVLAVDTLL